MKYIFGLGNPGTQYDDTRHNAGFAVVDAAVARWLSHEAFTLVGAEKKKTYESWEFRYHGNSCAESERIYCIKPLTFMNRSGEVVADWMKHAPSDFTPSTDLWIVHDELDIPLGTLKIGAGNSSAGHNGVQSIIDSIGTQSFIRFRVGIYPPEKIGKQMPKEPVADFVLKRFTPSESEAMEGVVASSVDALQCALGRGIAKAQMEYHGNKKPSESSLSAEVRRREEEH